MPKPADDLSALFRTLAPDDSNFQVSVTNAAREATQRWPLFQAVSPRKSATTPPLSTQERQRWSQQDQHVAGERKPALSLPGLSDKMARSLDKMAGRPVEVPVQNLAKRSEQSPLPLTPTGSGHDALPGVSMNARSALFSGGLTAGLDREEQRPGLGLFGAVAGSSMDSRSDESAVTHADDSLASVFSRIEKQLDAVNRPIEKKSSFLSRLGKR